MFVMSLSDVLSYDEKFCFGMCVDCCVKCFVFDDGVLFYDFEFFIGEFFGF